MRFFKITRGFSLIELLITLSILAILISLVQPSWKSYLLKSKGRVLLEQLSQALAFARQEAIVRQELITLCPSRDQFSCSGTWQQGFIVLRDTQVDGSLEKKGQILHVFQTKHQEGVLHWRAFPQNKEVCHFLPSGATNHENGTFWYCYARGKEPAWALRLSQGGRSRIIYPDREGRLRDDRGYPLPCF